MVLLQRLKSHSCDPGSAGFQNKGGYGSRGSQKDAAARASPPGLEDVGRCRARRTTRMQQKPSLSRSSFRLTRLIHRSTWADAAEEKGGVESQTHENVSRSARPRFEIVVTRALAGSRSGLSGGPSGGTLGGQRGEAWRMAAADRPGVAAHADGTSQETLRTRHPMTSRGDAHHLRRRLMLRVGMHRCSQQVPYIYTRTHVRLCVCFCERVLVCLFVCVSV